MSYSLQEYKIATFPGINSDSLPPSATKAGNGSHLIQVFNAQLDTTEVALNELVSSIGEIRGVSNDFEARLGIVQRNVDLQSVQNLMWTVVDSNSSCNTRASIVLISSSDTINSVTLSLTFNEQPGDSVELLNASLVDWNIDIGQNKYIGEPKPTRLYLPGNSFQVTRLIYTGFEFGYVPTNSRTLITEP